MLHILLYKLTLSLLDIFLKTLAGFKIKGQGMRRGASPETEPNLYTMPYLPPNPKPVFAATPAAPDCNSRRFTDSTATIECEFPAVPSPPVSSSNNLSLQNLLPTALLPTFQREHLSSTAPAWATWGNLSPFTNMATAAVGQSSQYQNAPPVRATRSFTLEDLLAFQNLLQQHQQRSPSSSLRGRM